MMTRDGWNEWVPRYEESDASSSYENIVNYIEQRAPVSSIAADLGCGAGGLARALSAAGYKTSGVDSSEAMIKSCKSRSPQAPVEWHLDDMTRFGNDESFDFLTCVRSTFFSLLTQNSQIEFFRNAARLLVPNGFLLLNTYIPTQEFLYPSKSLQVRTNTQNSVELSVTTVDRVNQTALFSEVVLTNGLSVQVLPVEQRFAWPAEIDLMASIAGLKLAERHADYFGSPVNGKAVECVTMYVK